MYYTTNNGEPCAFITKAKQRLKQFGHNVYLQNSSEFEMELYNPTTKTVLAKIKLNGSYISGGGIIVKPGQRIFLERYLDDARKFKFETYEVDGDSKEVVNAISNNGDVTVEFYNEYEPNTYTYDWYLDKSNYWPKANYNTYDSTNIPKPRFSTSALNNIVGTSTTNCFYNSSVTMDFLNESNQQPKLKTLSMLRKSTLETGTVEKGGTSDQSFTYVNKKFNTYATATSYWKILPESQKPFEKQDIKVFCTNCGAKRKKDSHKFCPKCGTQY